MNADTRERIETLAWMVVLAAAIAVAVALTGCTIEKHGKDWKAGAVTPPADSVVGITYRNVGVVIGQNPVNQTPQVNIGYQSATYHRVPTGSNISVVPVRAEVDFGQNGLNTAIKESIETGIR